ncbi:MAG TPA: 2-dehydropantoate 2-reductase [Thermoanaerobaculia bacterium]|jgi:2-dehydropantoate 2-reductase
MRIAVFGVGGVGGRFGAFLARAGEEMVFLARGSHLGAIRRDGLVLETPEEEIRVRPAAAVESPAEAGPVDAILLCVKAWQVEQAARSMGPLLGPETYVVPLQNGVEAADQLTTVLGRERVMAGMCRTFSFVVAPGRIQSVGRVHTVDFGELDASPSERAAELLRTLRSAGIQAAIPPDVHVALWQKFLMVVSIGGVGAVEQKPMGLLRSDPAIRARVRGAMEEILAVGRARGVALPEESVEKAMAFIDTLAPEGTSSLQRDIADGRPSELEAWNGAVVRLGAEAGVETPVHAAIYARLLPLERRARGELASPG